MSPECSRAILFALLLLPEKERMVHFKWNLPLKQREPDCGPVLSEELPGGTGGRIR